MPKNLVIVESPAKASTIKKYLGPDYEVLASYGHVRDLLAKRGAVEPDQGFRMHYVPIERNQRHVDAIARALGKAQCLYLATDLDREGEAISWHLKELLEERGLLRDREVRRVVFNEITKGAVQEAVAHPRELSMPLVNAQQARRALDYLVGFNLSPLLWRKIRQGLSAGRVQSPALRLICERERAIEAFVPQEYWNIGARVAADGAEFPARLSWYAGEKLHQFSVTNGTEAEVWRAELGRAARGQGELPGALGTLIVLGIERKQRRRQPAPPFITSTLQQEAVRKLGFSASRAMRVAQQLYEGVDLGSESVGLITYMRTDSLTLSQEALTEIRRFVAERYGADQVPDAPRVFKTRSKNAQEAHEAIRPTSVFRTPADVRRHLSADQAKLYELIWKRTVACQMVPALIDTVAADLACGEGNRFRASGSRVAAPGFMAVYSESRDEDRRPAEAGDDDDDADRLLPELQEGQRLALLEIPATQHFTEPPPRFGEASLVKALEELGIGRPSTYAAIIQTLMAREYVEMDNRRFRPTDVGLVVNDFLTEHFGRYVDYDFTARMEDDLDAVSRGESEWVPLMREFWEPFDRQVQEKEGNISRKEAVKARLLGQDPAGQPVYVRLGRFGPCVQIGEAEGEEKPRFYGLKPGQRMESITLDEALSLTRLPRDLGALDDGTSLSVNIGRFGPYVRYGSKYASLAAGDDPYTISPERAREVVAEKIAADAARVIRTWEGSEVRILNGRWGPFITDGRKNGKIPKDVDPLSLGLEQVLRLLEEAPEKPVRGGAKKKGATRQSAAATSGKEATKPASGRKTAQRRGAAAAQDDDAAPKAAPAGRTGRKKKVAGSAKTGGAKRAVKAVKKKVASPTKAKSAVKGTAVAKAAKQAAEGAPLETRKGKVAPAAGKRTRPSVAVSDNGHEGATSQQPKASAAGSSSSPDLPSRVAARRR
ncbi:MAG TPA: DNA topoisomerase I [Gammaproteobacteria bacterium]|nr:DNA topoisomerase I [Gammaproteobacteria bacterium]